MRKSDKEYFEELLAQIPDDIARLVDRQMEIAVAIAEAIDKSKYKTRKDFAEAIGMKPSMLSRILAGNVNLTLKTITKIESALETEIISIGEQELVREVQYVVLPESISRFAQFIASELSTPYYPSDNQKQFGKIFFNGSKPGYGFIKEGMYEARA